jgi:ADP-ribose pyrophosphatase YjhB (NUDIX family)
MKLLGEITEKDLGLENPKETLNQKYTLRKTGGAIIVNDKGEICMQYVGKFNCYILPGGGVRPGESIIDGLYREVREETGCEIEVDSELGMVIEYRLEENKHSLRVSYGYIAHLNKEKK